MRVRISHDFFEKGLQDYADFRTSWVRETCQNSADCGASAIKFEFSRTPDRGVIVELKGRSNEILTANRDGLLRPYSGQLSAFVTELAVDKRSALKSRDPEYRHYAGERLRHCVQRSMDVRDLVAGADTAVPTMEQLNCGVSAPGLTRVAALAPAGLAPSRRTASIGQEFLVKNETGLEIPRYFLPDTGEFSPYSHKLARNWGRILLTLHQVFEHEAEFAIGFVFSADDEAQFEEGQYGKVYFLNPVEVVEQKSSGSRSFRKRFQLTERDRLISIAAHEFVHGGLGFRYHDESFASKQTDVFGMVMWHRRKFNWCFQ